MGDATTALEELADLDDLEAALGQDYPGASLDDIDEDAVQRALGRGAVDDVAALRRIERELLEQGYLVRDGQRPARAVARAPSAGSARPRCARCSRKLEAGGRGGHDVQDAGAAGELTGRQPRRGSSATSSRSTSCAPCATPCCAAGRPAAGVRLHVEDFEVVETERRTTAAVALLVDLSFSMELRGTWGTAKQTALALHSLVTTKYPQDAIEIIGFSDYAQVLHARAARRARRAAGAGHQPAARARCSPAATSASTPTPSRSCSS